MAFLRQRRYALTALAGEKCMGQEDLGMTLYINGMQ